MKAPVSAAACRSEARVIVVLLDAAHEAGLMADPQLLARWLELRAKSSPADDFVAEAVPLWDLLCAVMQKSTQPENWITRRWREVESRLVAASSLPRKRGLR